MLLIRCRCRSLRLDGDEAVCFSGLGDRLGDTGRGTRLLLSCVGGGGCIRLTIRLLVTLGLHLLRWHDEGSHDVPSAALSRCFWCRWWYETLLTFS